MVLDDAHNKIAEDYNFTLDELRPRSSDLGPFTQRILSRLSVEHSKLLSIEALTLIFNSADHSMWDEGNKAAHEAPISDHIDAVLEATLTEMQRPLLRKIYYFAHSCEPDFETPTV
jgi:hypothetical protein